MDDEAPAAAASSAADSASSAAAASSDAIIAAATSSSASGPARFVLNLPPGYHFLPTNAELILHYLRPRLANHRLPLQIFFDEHILHYHPDKLIEKYREYGEDRWFFFTRRERKHGGGSRPNRATPDNGHWNATGSPKRIRSGGGALVGRVRTLVFYDAPRRKKKKSHEEDEAEDGLPLMTLPATEGKERKGVKTDWTMYEYESLSSEEEFLATGVDGKMDVIVLCTIQKKKQKRKEESETKKRTSKKRKGKDHEEAVPADEQGSCAGGKAQARKKRKLTPEGEAQEEEDHVQRTLAETEAAIDHELAVQAFNTDGVANFTVDQDPTASMPHYCFYANTSSAVSMMPPQETTAMMMSAPRGDNRISVYRPSIAAMENYSQFQAPPLGLGQELPIPYLHPKILAPPLLGGGNINNCNIMVPTPNMWMDGIIGSDLTVPPPPLLEELLPTPPWICQQQTPCNTTKAEFHLYGLAPGLPDSNHGFPGDGHRLSTGVNVGGRVDLLGLSFPSQPSYGAGSRSPTQGKLVHSTLSVEGWRTYSVRHPRFVSTDFDETPPS